MSSIVPWAASVVSASLPYFRLRGRTRIIAKVTIFLRPGKLYPTRKLVNDREYQTIIESGLMSSRVVLGGRACVVFEAVRRYDRC